MSVVSSMCRSNDTEEQHHCLTATQHVAKRIWRPRTLKLTRVSALCYRQLREGPHPVSTQHCPCEEVTVFSLLWRILKPEPHPTTSRSTCYGEKTTSCLICLCAANSLSVVENYLQDRSAKLKSDWLLSLQERASKIKGGPTSRPVN